MTIEEAKEFGNMWLQLNEDCKDSNTYAFFQIAIKLLEQEFCEDAISRQAVLEYIEGSEAELGHSSENELVCQYFKELPPVIPQQKTGVKE